MTEGGGVYFKGYDLKRTIWEKLMRTKTYKKSRHQI